MRHFALIPALGLLACNQPPTAPTLQIQPVNPTTADDLEVVLAMEASDPDEDELKYSYSWFQEGTATNYTETTVPAAATSKGETWSVFVSASDGEFETETVSVTTTIRNSLPTVEHVSLLPAAPLTTDNLLVTVELSDGDEDDTEALYTWLIDGEESLYIENTIPAAATRQYQEWTVVVTPFDGQGEGESTQATVMIGNTAPEMINIELSPEAPQEESSLVATIEATDTDGDELSFHYAWSVNGSVVLENEEGTLDGTWFDKHQEVSVNATPSDGWLEGEPMASNTITILNTLPTVNTVVLTPEDPLETDTLACSATDSADADGDTLTTHYAWTVDGVVVLDSEANTLTGDLFDKHNTIYCTATVHDGEETGESATSNSVTAVNTPPAIATANILPFSPSADDTLSLQMTASDDDGDFISYATTWYVDGITTSALDTLSGDLFARDQQVYATLLPTDGEEVGASVTTSAVTIVNALPLISSVILSPSSPSTNDVLTASLSATDSDDDTLSIDYAWTLDGSTLPTTESSLDGSIDFDKGAVIGLTVTPNDGYTDGSAVAASTVTVQNTAPTAPQVSIENEELMAGMDDIICIIDAGSADEDGDTISYDYSWTVDGTPYAGSSSTYASGDTIPGSDTETDEVWECTVTPWDDEEAGAPGAASVTVYCGATFEDDQVAYYPLDGDGTDQSGNNADAINYGVTAVEDQEGNANSAMYFDDTYMEAGDEDFLDGHAQMSLCAWVYPEPASNQIDGHVMLSKDYQGDGDEGTNSWSFGHYDVNNGGTLQVTIWTSQGQFTTESTAVLPVTTWSQACWTYDGTELRLFQNSTEVATESASGDINSSDSSMRLGKCGGDSRCDSRNFTGALNEVRLWSRALSENEINCASSY